MFAKTHGTFVLDLSSTQDMTIVRTGTVHLECTSGEPLEESVALTSLNQLEIYWGITPGGNALLDLAPWTRIK